MCPMLGITGLNYLNHLNLYILFVCFCFHVNPYFLNEIYEGKYVNILYQTFSYRKVILTLC